MTPRQLYYSLKLFNTAFVNHEITIRYVVDFWCEEEAIDHFSAYCAGGEL